MEPEIYTKMLRNLSEKLWAKFPAITLSLSDYRLKTACLQDVFSDISELEASPEVGQLLQQNERKRRKRKGKKSKKNKKLQDIRLFLIQKLKNLKILISAYTWAKVFNEHDPGVIRIRHAVSLQMTFWVD